MRFTEVTGPPNLPLAHDAVPDSEEGALLALLWELKRRDYRFVTPTPATHARVLARPSHARAEDLRDVFGWNLPFAREVLDARMLEALESAGVLVTADEACLKSRYRVSTLGEDLFLHSAYPTDAEDAVFFGPDSYRFANLIRRELELCPPGPGARLVDIGAGAGVGAVVAARLHPELRITMTDINPRALALAKINAHAAAIEAEYVAGADLAGVDDPIDIALANPPYIIDPAGREYRHGGDMHGARVAFDMAVEAAGRLAPDGRFILYTGSAILKGADPLRHALEGLVAAKGLAMRYWEMDPDVFGEELEHEAYSDVERIALVGAVINRTT